jgi:peptidoglycan/LPS O-acetylase OafA/YrhL
MRTPGKIRIQLPGEQAPRPGRRLDSLTSARFIAAFVVFGFHAMIFLDPAPGFMKAVFDQGRAGVSFFFVLSGFIITCAYKGARPAPFLGARLRRIYPAYIFTLALALVARLLTDPSSLGSGWATLFLLQSWIPSSKFYFAVNVPAWSLSCEMFFYAVSPMLIPRLARLSGRTRGRLFIVLLAVPLLLAANVALSGTVDLGADTIPIWLAYYFPASRLPEYVIGVLAALYLIGDRPRTVSPRVAIPIAAAAYLLARQAGPFSVVCVTLVPFCLLILSLAQADISGRPARILHHSWLIFAGDCSYSFYLVHHIFVMRLCQPGFARLNLGGWHPMLGWSGFLITLTISAISAAAIHHFVERRALPQVGKPIDLRIAA